MRIPRVYLDGPLAVGEDIALPTNTVHYLVDVLRLRSGSELRLFNGRNGEFCAFLASLGPGIARAKITAHHAIDRESPLAVTLVQGVSRSARMDYTLQKSVELGVASIVPVFCERSAVRLDPERRRSRTDHWQRVVISACEQCGRNRPPRLTEPALFTDWLDSYTDGPALVLDSRADKRLADLVPPVDGLTLVVGPEGGFSAKEVKMCQLAGFQPLALGPRILRTETAAVAALAAIQALWGDF
jgi:16S rRNA (uracil1498-N3)-methyltransferase